MKRLITFRRLRYLAVVATALSASGVVGAQPVAFRPSTRVRVEAPTVEPDRVIGRVLSVDSAAVVIKEDWTPREVRIPLEAITIAESSRGRRRFVWAGIGAGIGLVGGAAVGSVMASRPSTREGGADLAAVGVGFFGMIGGSLLGAIGAPERWQVIPK